MNTTHEKKQAYVTTGFLAKFTQITCCDGVSFNEIARFIVLQPQLIGHLLNEANLLCNRYKLLDAKPTNVHGIISVLGVFGTIEACAHIKEAPSGEKTLFCNQTIDTYALAVVLSELAERRLGRFLAPDFFLIGLIHDLVNPGLVSLERCNEAIVRHFDGDPPERHPTVTEALELIAGFKSSPPMGSRAVFLAWRAANTHALEHTDEVVIR